MASSKREEERNEKIIRGLMKLPPNRRCINCNSLGPQYVCPNFWTFVCTTCSGIHREFTHRVKSVSMSKFTTQEVAALQDGGNQRARETYLKNWDLQRQRLPNSSDVDKVREFIKAVYVAKRYAGGNNSEQPSRDMQGERNIADETRRASSYHSFSQSPPYDFQYEDRLNRKQGNAISRKPGSDRGLFDRKAVSFVYSPGRMSDHLYEDRFANEGSSSRVSDYSMSSGGEPFRSAPQSPNLQRDGFSSPTSDSSRDIVDGLQRQTISSYAEATAKRNADKVTVPHPQRTMSSGNCVSFDKNAGSGSLFNVCEEPKRSAATSENKVSTSSPSSENWGGLSLFNDSFGIAAHTSAPALDLHQAPVAVNFFQSPQASSVLPPNFQEKALEPSQPNNEAWATFDSPQLSAPVTNTAVSGADPLAGLSAKNQDPVSSSNAVLEWANFQNTAFQEPASLTSNRLNEVSQNTYVPSIASGQLWQAFEEFDEQQHKHVEVQSEDLCGSAQNNSSVPDLFLGLKNKEDFRADAHQELASGEGFSFPSVPSHVVSASPFDQSSHPFMTDVANVGKISSNPFDIPDDSEFEPNHTFLGLSNLQAALPSMPLPSPPFTGNLNESWFPPSPIDSPGGMSYITAQVPSAQLTNVATHGPVASVGGNPFA